MAVYAIGDVQGCFDSLRKLLDRLAYDPERDRLWFTGDLVNRGPDSAAVLRFIRGLEERAIAVLGNHDLHLIAVAFGHARLKPKDTLSDLLRAPDRDDLVNWLRQRPLFHHDASLGWSMVHAGLLPQWELSDIQRLAREAEAVLSGDAAGEFFAQMYGDLPDHWREDLRGAERLRVIINAFTRLRYCDLEGNMDLRHKGPPGSQPPDLLPWFLVPARKSHSLRLAFGHWSTLGPIIENGVVCLDSGCLWGGKLTALRLDSATMDFTAIGCPQHLQPGKRARRPEE